MEIFVARQPVFTADKKIFAYELLFRSGLQNAFPNIEGNTATSAVLDHTFFSFGLKTILGGKPGLVNFTRELLCQRVPLLFPKEHVIVEVLEDVEPDEEVIEALAELRKKGYKIALDDFLYHTKFESMIGLSHIIKFDLMATPLHTLGPLIKNLRSKYHLTLLAEKVETHEEFELAQKMGFGLFQGYFFAKPEILSKKEISTSSITKIQLINEIGRMELDLKRIEDLIRKDVSISFKLLKFINSAYFRRLTSIDTIKDAMVILGIDELKKFINVVALSNISDGKPNELIRASVIRARMCELCGGLIKSRFSTEELFTLGLFSTMDALLDMPMLHFLKQVSFSTPIKKALMGQDPDFKKILFIVKIFEQGRWDHQIFKVMEGKTLLRKLPEFYRDSVAMADSLFEKKRTL